MVVKTNSWSVYTHAEPTYPPADGAATIGAISWSKYAYPQHVPTCSVAFRYGLEMKAVSMSRMEGEPHIPGAMWLRVQSATGQTHRRFP